MDLEPERLLAELRKTRIGHVAIPRDHPENRRKMNNARTSSETCLVANVPSWLIRGFDHSSDAPRVTFEVFSVASEHELWATLGLKQTDVELRIVLPLDDAGVQAFFRYGMRGSDLRLALAAEDGDISAHVIVGITVGDGRAFEKLLRKARCLDGSLTRLLHFAELNSSGVSMPSDKVDNSANRVVVILASNRAHAIVATAPTSREALQAR